MKTKVLSILILFFISTGAMAQGDEYGSDPDACQEALSLYGEFVKQGKAAAKEKRKEDAVAAYKDALPGWKKACEICPKSRKSLYINGITMYRAFAIAEKDAAKRKLLVDTLLNIYDKRIENFGQEGYVKGRKGSEVLRFRKKEVTVANQLFKESMDLRGAKTEAGVFSGYYQTLYAMYKNGEVEKAAVLEAYLPVSDLIAEAMVAAEGAKNPEKTKAGLEKAKTNIDEYFVQVGACEDIVEVFGKKIESDPENLQLKERTLKILNKRDCTESDLFGEVAEAVHTANPTAASAFALGQRNFSQRSYTKALGYYKQAMELDPDGPDFASYAVGAGACSAKQGSMKSAWNFANKALAKDPGNGRAYLIKAQAVAGSKCGSDEKEIRYVYWLAYDYAAKAKSDPATSSAASSAMSAYKKNWPSKADLFKWSMLDVKTVSVGCWIGESTEVRQGAG